MPADSVEQAHSLHHPQEQDAGRSYCTRTAFRSEAEAGERGRLHWKSVYHDQGPPPESREQCRQSSAGSGSVIDWLPSSYHLADIQQMEALLQSSDRLAWLPVSLE